VPQDNALAAHLIMPSRTKRPHTTRQEDIGQLEDTFDNKQGLKT
jgi:hypothetical protein